MRRMLKFFTLFACTGCGPNIAGDWSGTLECSSADVGDYEVDIELELEVEDAGEFSGELHLLSELGYLGYVMVLDQSYDVEVEQEEPRGEQDLEVEGDCAEATLTLDGEQLDYSCDEAGAFEQEGTWDGADTISIDDDDCEGELER